ncbi:MAG: hypothetical protein AAFV96_14765, partial [Pseudomonadota bacterium]
GVLIGDLAEGDDQIDGAAMPVSVVKGCIGALRDGSGWLCSVTFVSHACDGSASVLPATCPARRRGKPPSAGPR